MNQRIAKVLIFISISAFFTLIACQNQIENNSECETCVAPPPSVFPTESEDPTPLLPTSSPSISSPVLTPQMTSTVSIAKTIQAEPGLTLSSPLQRIEIAELKSILSNPFVMPTYGQDDGHQGVDFSFYQYQGFDSILHYEIISVLPGIISAVVNDRPPYGNAVIIETELSQLSEWSLAKITALNLDSTIRHSSYINCPPEYALENMPDQGKESIYILYAHMENLPDFNVGEVILTGQGIGPVGNSGMSGNPHLHLETRIGPSHATFTSMADYDNSATIEEIENYCLWRVSNIFKLVDPMVFYQ